jgi:hypothetical protein
MYWDFDILHECSLKQDLPMGTNRYDLVTLTLVFNLHIENFPCNETFPWLLIIFHDVNYCNLSVFNVK